MSVSWARFRDGIGIITASDILEMRAAIEKLKRENQKLRKELDSLRKK